MAGRTAERRGHRRAELSCPVRIVGHGGETLAKSRTRNLSDGGAMFPLPAEDLPECGREMRLRLSVPRTTLNTYMLERVEATARVVRHQRLADGDDVTGVAVRFEPPLGLQLEA